MIASKASWHDPVYSVFMEKPACENFSALPRQSCLQHISALPWRKAEVATALQFDEPDDMTSQDSL